MVVVVIVIVANQARLLLLLVAFYGIRHRVLGQQLANLNKCQFYGVSSLLLLIADCIDFQLRLRGGYARDFSRLIRSTDASSSSVPVKLVARISFIGRLSRVQRERAYPAPDLQFDGVEDVAKLPRGKF